MISLAPLEGFFWVARTGGYSNAARAFPYPITQPGVFKQVKKLEDEVGVKLVKRAGRDGVELTPEGQRLYEYIAPFLEELPDVVGEIQHGDVAGDIRIDAAGLAVRYLMPPWLKILRKKLPRLRVHMQEVTIPDMWRVKTGKCDLIIDFVQEIPESYARQEVARAYGFIALPKSHPLAKRSRLNLEQLSNIPFVSYSPELPHFALQQRGLLEAGISATAAVSAGSVESILALVAAGLGFSLIPWTTTQGPKTPGVVTKRLRNDAAEFPIFAIWRQQSARARLIEAMLEHAPTA